MESEAANVEGGTNVGGPHPGGCFAGGAAHSGVKPLPVSHIPAVCALLVRGGAGNEWLFCLCRAGDSNPRIKRSAFQDSFDLDFGQSRSQCRSFM